MTKLITLLVCIILGVGIYKEAGIYSALGFGLLTVLTLANAILTESNSTLITEIANFILGVGHESDPTHSTKAE